MCAEDVVRLHRGHVEEEDDHAAVADGVRNGVGGAGTFIVHGNNDGFGVILGGCLDFFDIGVGKAGYFLLLAVVGNFKLIGSQSLDRLPGAVNDRHINANHVGLRAQNERWVRLWRLLLLRRCGRRLLLRRRGCRLLLRDCRNRGERYTDSDQNRHRAADETTLKRVSSRTNTNSLFAMTYGDIYSARVSGSDGENDGVRRDDRQESPKRSRRFASG